MNVVRRRQYYRSAKVSALLASDRKHSGETSGSNGEESETKI